MLAYIPYMDPVGYKTAPCFQGAAMLAAMYLNWCFFPRLEALRTKESTRLPAFRRGSGQQVQIPREGVQSDLRQHGGNADPFEMVLLWKFHLVGGWALPLWKMMEFVNGKDDIP